MLVPNTTQKSTLEVFQSGIAKVEWDILGLVQQNSNKLVTSIPNHHKMKY